ncbi:MAG TPA: TlpA disulfide reductase family protein [Polyangiaceae bacterium]|jgi:thiol-disulfide isomerase/thioredoxin
MSEEPRSIQTTLGALGLVMAILAGFALLPRVFTQRVREAPDFNAAVVANGAGLGAAMADSKTLSLSALRGNAVLLDFWATWCGPCRAEAPIVDQVSRRWHDKGVVVVGVNTDLPDQGDPKAFAMAHNLTYPIVHDTTGEAQRAFAVDSLPTLVVVSRTGKITAVRTGMTDDAELERLIRQAL